MTQPLLIAVQEPWLRWSEMALGILLMVFATVAKPEPGLSALAALTGPNVPPGWSYNPSAWT